MELTLGKRLKELPGPILITGHTGFKGTWLTFLLEKLNVPVLGLALTPEKDSLFDRTKRTGAIREAFIDIRDAARVSQFLTENQPSAVIHLAAQPLVIASYKTPRETFETNVMGTANVLDAAFSTPSVKAVVVATTDKVYRNDDLGRAFIENDPLEGKDPYSASKVGTESVVAAWQQIAKIAKEGQYELILTGRESIDYNGAQTGAMIAEIMDIPSISIIKKLTVAANTATVEREIEGGKEVITVDFPFLASVTEGVAEPKIPNMRGIMSARTKPLLVVEAIAVDTLSSISSFDLPAARSTVKLISTNESAKLIEALHSEAKVI